VDGMKKVFSIGDEAQAVESAVLVDVAVYSAIVPYIPAALCAKGLNRSVHASM
jgi:hypothetical protein